MTSKPALKYSELIALLAVVAIGLLAATPLFEARLPHGADTLTHLYKLVQLDHLVRQGIFYTRWFPYKASGFGAPLFQYYAPLAYYVAEGFRLLGWEAQAALNLAFGLTLVGAGLGMYVWVRDVLDEGSALVASAAYVCGPYMLFTAYFRGGFTEQFVLMLMPFVLWAFRRLAATSQMRYLAAGAVSYAAVILSHNLTTLVFSAALLAYTLIMATDGSQPLPAFKTGLKRLLALWAVMGLGLGLSAFFWLPAILERDAIQTNLVYATPALDYHHHFIPLKALFSTPLAITTRPALSLIAVGLAVIGLFGTAWNSLVIKKRGETSKAVATCSNGKLSPEGTCGLEIWLAALITTAGVVIASPISVLIWEALPPFRLFQFPHRFLSVASVFVAFLAGVGAHSTRQWLRTTGRREPLATGTPTHVRLSSTIMLIIVMGLLLSQMRALSQVRYFQPLPEVDVNFIMQKEREVAPIIAGYTGIYVPAAVKAWPSSNELAQDGPERLDVDSLPIGATLLATKYSPLRYVVTLSAPEPFSARFRTFYFPGWKAEIDGQPVPITVTDPHGQISVDAPAGRHHLVVWFGSTPIRTIANVLSVCSAIVLCLVVAGLAQRLGASSDLTGFQNNHRRRTPNETARSINPIRASHTGNCYDSNSDLLGCTSGADPQPTVLISPCGPRYGEDRRHDRQR